MNYELKNNKELMEELGAYKRSAYKESQARRAEGLRLREAQRNLHLLRKEFENFAKTN